jgi:hypothetical protein
VAVRVGLSKNELRDEMMLVDLDGLQGILDCLVVHFGKVQVIGEPTLIVSTRGLVRATESARIFPFRLK